MSKIVKTLQEAHILVGEVSRYYITKMNNTYRVPDDEECYGENTLKDERRKGRDGGLRGPTESSGREGHLREHLRASSMLSIAQNIREKATGISLGRTSPGEGRVRTEALVVHGCNI